MAWAKISNFRNDIAIVSFGTSTRIAVKSVYSVLSVYTERRLDVKIRWIRIPQQIDVNTHEPFKTQSLRELPPTRAQGKLANLLVLKCAAKNSPCSNFGWKQ